jgi:hypothetical protein
VEVLFPRLIVSRPDIIGNTGENEKLMQGIKNELPFSLIPTVQ